MTPYTLDDADRDLRAALDAGNTPEIDRLSRIVDDLTRSPHEPPTLAASALWYAQQGLRVFPLSPMSKIPFKGSQGFKDATTDEATIRAWWERTPDANVGLATGHIVDVVDVDGPEGQKSRAAYWCEKGADCPSRHALPGEHPAELSDQGQASTCGHALGVFGKIDADSLGKVLTPRRGGMHIYVPATGEGNGTSIAPGVDYRGLGGYVVAPPSRTEIGTYRWLGTPRLGGAA